MRGGGIPESDRDSDGKGLQGTGKVGYIGSAGRNPRIASGMTVFPTLSASMGEKQWLGNQEALSGNYHILEDK